MQYDAEVILRRTNEVSQVVVEPLLNRAAQVSAYRLRSLDVSLTLPVRLEVGLS